MGARLSKHLAVKGYNVTVFDSYRPSNYNEWILLMDEIIIGDISDESAISRLADKNFDIVIHLISLDHYKSENDPNFVSSINVMPTWNLLDSFTKNGLKIHIFLNYSCLWKSTQWNHYRRSNTTTLKCLWINPSFIGKYL